VLPLWREINGCESRYFGAVSIHLPPTTLFEGHYIVPYDIVADGRHFLMIKKRQALREIIVVKGWLQDLQQTTQPFRKITCSKDYYCLLRSSKRNWSESQSLVTTRKGHFDLYGLGITFPDARLSPVHREVQVVIRAKARWYRNHRLGGNATSPPYGLYALR